MLRIARQTLHTLNGTCVAAEVLARLQIGSRVLPPPIFMHGSSNSLLKFAYGLSDFAV